MRPDIRGVASIDVEALRMMTSRRMERTPMNLVVKSMRKE